MGCAGCALGEKGGLQGTVSINTKETTPMPFWLEAVREEDRSLGENESLLQAGIVWDAREHQKSGRLFLHVGRKRAWDYHRRRLENAAVIALAEGLVLSVALLLAHALELWLNKSALFPRWAWGMPVLWWFVALALRLLPGWGLGAAEELRRLVMSLAMLFMSIMVFLFLARRATSSACFLLSVGGVLAIVLVPMARYLARGVLIRFKRWGVATVIYGGNGMVEQVIYALQKEPQLGYVPVGIFHLDQGLWGSKIKNIPVLGGVDANTAEAPIAVVALPGLPVSRLSMLLDGPLAIYKQVVLIPELVGVPSLWVRASNIGGTLALELTSNLLDPLAQGLKRLMDVVLLLSTLPIWLPLIGIIALLVWLEDRKAPFFTQERIGLEGRKFHVIKFRTMVPNAEAVLQHYLNNNPQARAEWMATFKLKNDPRITRIGRWLRRLSLDELPQLFNVLKGDMSLVGPRPLPAYHHHELPPQVQRLRLRVRPGVTGLWQVSGRSDTGNEGMARWDSFYVRNWSIWLDLVILMRTIPAVLRGHGAY